MIPETSRLGFLAPTGPKVEHRELSDRSVGPITSTRICRPAGLRRTSVGAALRGTWQLGSRARLQARAGRGHARPGKDVQHLDRFIICSDGVPASGINQDRIAWGEGVGADVSNYPPTAQQDVRNFGGVMLNKWAGLPRTHVCDTH